MNRLRHNSPNCDLLDLAVIAAAEAREKAHKAKTKPPAKGDKKLPPILSAAEKRQEELERERDAQLKLQEAPRSEAAKQAMEAAKRNEAALANQLGYNPYEANKSTAGQARNATTIIKMGALGESGASGGDGGGHASHQRRVPTVAPPADTAGSNDTDNEDNKNALITSEFQDFDDAYTTVIANNEHEAVVTAFGIIRKLVKNATTKGQSAGIGEAEAAKFRRVRLSNPKIKVAVLDVHGAFDLMMSFGFQLTEDGEETYLAFPLGSKGPDFLLAAIRQMETFEES